MRVGKLPAHSYEIFNVWVSLDRGDPRFEAKRVRMRKGARKCFSPPVLKCGTVETLSDVPSLDFEVITAYQQRHFSVKPWR